MVQLALFSVTKALSVPFSSSDTSLIIIIIFVYKSLEKMSQWKDIKDAKKELKFFPVWFENNAIIKKDTRLVPFLTIARFSATSKYNYTEMQTISPGKELLKATQNVLHPSMHSILVSRNILLRPFYHNYPCYFKGLLIHAVICRNQVLVPSISDKRTRLKDIRPYIMK